MADMRRKLLRVLRFVLVFVLGLVILIVLMLATCVLADVRVGPLCSGITSELPPPHSDVIAELKNASPQLMPRWTPDGSQVVLGIINYDRGPPEGRIYAVASDGSSLLSITEDDGEYFISHSPSVSPGSSRIAYATYRYQERGPRYFEIETVALDGTDRRKLTEESGQDLSPVWSPDGSRIAFVRHDDYDKCDRPRRSGVYTMVPDGSDVRKVVDIPSQNGEGTPEGWDAWYHSGPVWSPDGQILAYVVNEREKAEGKRPGESTRPYNRNYTSLYTVNADGSDLKRVGLFSAGSIVSPPEWSPDGQRIAFVGVADGRPKLHSIDLEDSVLRDLADPDAQQTPIPNTSYSGRVSWTRDGSQILFHLARTSPLRGQTLYAENADGSALRILGNGLLGALSPDGSRVAVALYVSENYSGFELHTPAPSRPLLYSDVVVYTAAVDGSDVRVIARSRDDGRLEAVGPEQRPSTDIASCSAGVIVPDPESNPGLVRDCEALVEMSERLVVTGLNWDEDTPITEWEGVTLEVPIAVEDGSNSEVALSPLRVRGLFPQDQALMGVFPISVTDLAGLWSLDLSDNLLVGEIPPELGRLADLRVIDLAGNNLSGPIPPELGQLVNLQELSLPGYLDSPIPPELGRLASLEVLTLWGVQIGPIPPELGRLASLEVLTLWGVQIGPIPPELGRLTKLRELTLRGHLDGPIPPELGNLSSLRRLDLYQNKLSGPIPPELGNLTDLEWLFLSGNKLSGPVPPELGNLTSLRRLNLNQNELSGHIPLELGNLTDLERLDLSGNKLSGPVPPALGNLTSLRRLNLNQNKLSGHIPLELGNLTDLERLDLDQDLSGCIPLGLPGTYGFAPCER